ncbi:17369_t:CDS:2, partial [Funneliformis geosporum]
EKKMEGKRTKKPHYYFAHILMSFPFGALPLGYHSPIPPNMKIFCDKNFCKESTDEESEVLIYGHTYHEKCFRVLEEAQEESDINEKINKDNEEFEETDNYKSKVETSSELQKRILTQIFRLNEQNAKVYNALSGENRALKKQLEDYHSQYNTLERRVKRLERDVGSLKIELKDLDEYVDREI